MLRLPHQVRFGPKAISLVAHPFDVVWPPDGAHHLVKYLYLELAEPPRQSGIPVMDFVKNPIYPTVVPVLTVPLVRAPRFIHALSTRTHRATQDPVDKIFDVMHDVASMTFPISANPLGKKWKAFVSAEGSLGARKGGHSGHVLVGA